MSARKRFVLRMMTSWGDKFYRAVDTTTGKAVYDSFTNRAAAVLFVDELNRIPWHVPGVKVRIIDGNVLGASRRDDLCHIVDDKNWYKLGDEGVLAFPHPNQRDVGQGCKGWWYVEVEPKHPVDDAEKLYVAVWPGAFEVLP